jgi:hypothetical protein
MQQKREFLVFINTLLLNHHRLNSHLMRIGIGEGMYHCKEDFAKPDQIFWQYRQLQQRESFLEELYAKEISLISLRNIHTLNFISIFLKFNKIEL